MVINVDHIKAIKQNTSLSSPNSKNSTSIDILQKLHFCTCLTGSVSTSIDHGLSEGIHLRLGSLFRAQEVSRVTPLGTVIPATNGLYPQPRGRGQSPWQAEHQTMHTSQSKAWNGHQATAKHLQRCVPVDKVDPGGTTALEVRFHPEKTPSNSTFGRWNVQDMFNEKPAHSRNFARFSGGPSKITPNIPWTHPTLQAYGCSGARTGREAKDTNSPWGCDFKNQDYQASCCAWKFWWNFKCCNTM